MAALALSGTDGAIPHADALAALVPAVVVGHLAGRRVFARIADHHYEPVLTAVLIATALAGPGDRSTLMAVTGEPLIEVTVPASVEEVWAHLHEPALIRRWFGWEYDGLTREIEIIFVEGARRRAGAHGRVGARRPRRARRPARRDGPPAVPPGPGRDVRRAGEARDHVHAAAVLSRSPAHPGEERRTHYLSADVAAAGRRGARGDRRRGVVPLAPPARRRRPRPRRRPARRRHKPGARALRRASLRASALTAALSPRRAGAGWDACFTSLAG